tara:strand:+ start:235 stop:489 length:255 start_codon:yes stop_codon:yes gene_type:complete
MKHNIFPILSYASSLLLFSISFFTGKNLFYAFVAVNFILFHGIWVSRYFVDSGFVFCNAFFVSNMRVPLILFVVCGISNMTMLL